MKVCETIFSSQTVSLFCSVNITKSKKLLNEPNSFFVKLLDPFFCLVTI
jgi:hypothetical protein